MRLLARLFRTKAINPDEALHVGQLPASLGPFTLTMIGVGATIGTGIFFVMAEAVPKAGPAVLLSFLLAGLTAGLTALCYAELSSSIPASGSSYSYVFKALGEFPAFLVAACMTLEYALAGSATAIGWSGYLNNFLENAFSISIPEALRSPSLVQGKAGLEMFSGRFNLPPVILIIMCGLLLMRGTRESAIANAVMVVTKLAVLVFFCGVALTAFHLENFHPFWLAAGMQGVTAAAGTVFFSFVGLDTIATAGAEAKNPRRTLPLAIIAALIIVVLAYLAVAISAIGAQPIAKFAGQDAGLAEILKAVTGKSWPAVVLSAGAVISVFSVTLLIIYGQTRIFYAISRDGLIPRLFQKLSSKTHVPVANTWIVCTAIALVAGFVDSSYLWDMVSMGTLVAFSAVAICVPVMRNRQHRADGFQAEGFRLPFGPYAIPVASILSCLYIMKDLPGATFQAFGFWILLALVAYFSYMFYQHRRTN